MATGQIHYKVRMSNGAEDTSPGVTEENFFGQNNNIVTLVGASKFTKVGIQAPPGTKIVFNNTRTIMIGRTGVFEIEAEITNMYIIRLTNYDNKPDEELADKREGFEIMKSAVETWYNYLLNPTRVQPPDPDWPIDDNALIEAKTIFENDYNRGSDKYMVGYNGIYEPNGFVSINNVIIDYQTE